MGINLSDVLMSAGDGARITVFTPEGDVLVDRMLCSEIPHIRIATYTQNQVIWQAGNDGVLYILERR